MLKHSQPWSFDCQKWPLSNWLMLFEDQAVILPYPFISRGVSEFRVWCDWMNSQSQIHRRQAREQSWTLDEEAWGFGLVMVGSTSRGCYNGMLCHWGWWIQIRCGWKLQGHRFNIQSLRHKQIQFFFLQKTFRCETDVSLLKISSLHFLETLWPFWDYSVISESDYGLLKFFLFSRKCCHTKIANLFVNMKGNQPLFSGTWHSLALKIV